MLWRRALIAIAALWCVLAFWQTHKSMPPGTRIASSWYAVPASEVGFLADITAADAYGRPAVSQAIARLENENHEGWARRIARTEWQLRVYSGFAWCSRQYRSSADQSEH